MTHTHTHLALPSHVTHAWPPRYHFPSQQEIERYVAGDGAAISAERPNMLLTFDDGLSDHYQYVLPELRRRGLWGIFYIPAGPYQSGRMLDVHCIHLLIGRYGGEKVKRPPIMLYCYVL